MAATASTFVSKTSQGAQSFLDWQIQQIADGTSLSIGEWVRTTAKEKGITIPQSQIRRFAKAVSRLSDAEVDLDEVEELLIALRRAQVITPSQRGLLQVHYLR
jgi:hypothetical protein